MATQRPRTKDEKRANFENDVRVAAEVQAFTNSPTIRSWFAKKELAWTANMIGCAPTDDNARRAAALKLQSYLELKQEIGVLVGNGLVAEKQLSNMKDDDYA